MSDSIGSKDAAELSFVSNELDRTLARRLKRIWSALLALIWDRENVWFGTTSLYTFVCLVLIVEILRKLFDIRYMQSNLFKKCTCGMQLTIMNIVVIGETFFFFCT